MNLGVATAVAFATALSLATSLGAALAFGGPVPPHADATLANPFEGTDFVALPSVRRYTARDGTPLAFRRYAASVRLGGRASQALQGSVVLVHGSSASSQTMHPLAQSFARAGFDVYALDVRGHGESGTRGDIAYVGQLEDDLEDFMLAVQPCGPRTLLGFSAGGGFALRVAGGEDGRLFDNFLLMAPYTGRDAPNFRPQAGGWVSVGTPRLAALTLLNRLGITRFNHLPVVDFAVGDSPHPELAPWYSYALATNFQPIEDYQRNIRELHQPVAVLVGMKDTVFVPEKFAQVFADAGRPDIPVTLVPDAGHISLTLAPDARAVAVATVQRLDAQTTQMSRVELR